MLAAAAFVLGLLAAADQPADSAAPPPPPPRPMVVAEPQIVALPSAADMAKAYPTVARRLGLAGRVQMQCVVTEQGDLTACQALTESPPDYGFAHAALSLAPTIKYTPSSNGPRYVIIPIRFAPAP
jgi:TonB family protein